MRGYIVDPVDRRPSRLVISSTPTGAVRRALGIPTSTRLQATPGSDGIIVGTTSTRYTAVAYVFPAWRGADGNAHRSYAAAARQGYPVRWVR